MGSLAWLYAQQSKMTEARKLLVEGEPLVASIPIEHGKFFCKQAKVEHIVGEFNQAEESLEQARVIAQKTNCGKDSELGRLITETAQIFNASPPKEDSIDSPLGISTEGELTEEQRQQLKTQADMLIEQGDLDEAESLYDEALLSYESALKMYQQLNNQFGIASVYLKIGTAYEKQGSYETAIESFEIAHNISKDSKSLVYIDSLIAMGNINRLRGNYQKTLELLHHALEQILEQNDRFREMKTRGALAKHTSF